MYFHEYSLYQEFRMPRQGIEDRMSRAVSEIIGVIVLIGLAVLALGIVFLVLLAGPLPTSIPAFSGIISNNSNTIYIYHTGGDPLYSGRYSILVDGVDRTSSFVGPSPFILGTNLSYVSPTMPSQVVVIYNTPMGGGTVLLSANLLGSVTIPTTGGGGPSCSAVYVQSNSAHNSGAASSVTVNLGTPTTAGDLLVAGIEVDANAPTRYIKTVKDGAGDSFSYSTGSPIGSLNASTWYLANVPAGQTQVTVTLTGSTSSALEMYAAEYSGIATGTPLDQTAVGTGTGGPGHVLNSGSGTTTKACELIFGYCETSGSLSLTLDSPWNQRVSYNGNTIGDFSATSTGTYGVTGSTSEFDNWDCMLSTFKGP